MSTWTRAQKSSQAQRSWPERRCLHQDLKPSFSMKILRSNQNELAPTCTASSSRSEQCKPNQRRKSWHQLRKKAC